MHFTRSLYIITELILYNKRKTDVKKTHWLLTIVMVCTVASTILIAGYARTVLAVEEKTVWDKADEMLEAGEHKEALTLYNIAIELNQGHPDLYLAYFNRAHVLISLEQFEDAESDLDTTLELAPEEEEDWGE